MTAPSPHFVKVEQPLPRHRDWRALLPIIAGLYWLTAGTGWWLLWGLVPGLLLLGSGVSLLLWPGDPRINGYMAVGGLAGVVCAIPAAVPGGFAAGVVGAALSLASFVLAGRVSVATMARAEGAPSPDAGLQIDVKAAVDEALMGYFVGAAQLPSGEDVERMSREAHSLLETLDGIGALRDPATLHRPPPAPIDFRIEPVRVLRERCERLRYASGFEVDARLPGAMQWAAHPRNHESNAWLLRHADAGRPWLICIHGYRMGVGVLDLGLFAPSWLHRRLGLNLLMPTLPLHGSRRIGRRSGDQYLDGDLLDLVHAQSQALWDLRRAVAWIRSQDPSARIGVFGISLGGFNTALLAGYEEGLDFVVAGIPLVDIASTLWRVLPAAYVAYLDSRGITIEHYRQLLSVISPLSRPALVDASRRAIFAGAVDRVVVPENPVALGRHWGVPVDWYQGGHLTFRGEPAMSNALRGVMARAGWAEPLPGEPLVTTS